MHDVGITESKMPCQAYKHTKDSILNSREQREPLPKVGEYEHVAVLPAEETSERKVNINEQTRHYA